MKMSLNDLNLEDVQFADKNAGRIEKEWKTKFLDGALEHGGIGKPSLVERKGLIKEALNEHYDGISYTLAIEQRLNKARGTLSVLLQNRDGNLSAGQKDMIAMAISLLE